LKKASVLRFISVPHFAAASEYNFPLSRQLSIRQPLADDLPHITETMNVVRWLSVIVAKCLFIHVVDLTRRLKSWLIRDVFYLKNAMVMLACDGARIGPGSATYGVTSGNYDLRLRARRQSMRRIRVFQELRGSVRKPSCSKCWPGLMPTTLIEKLIHDFLPITEIRLPKPIKGLRQTEQATQSSALQNAEGAGDVQTFVDRRSRSFAFVYENQIGMNRQCKDDRCPFPCP
jgi:hypothetical protein